MSKNLKPFAELSKSGQRARLKKYEAEREKYGTKQCLANLVKDPVIRDNRDGSKRVQFRFALYIPGEETQFMNMSHYVAADKQELQDFLMGLKKGERVSVEYKINEVDGVEYGNIFQIFRRPRQEA